MASSAQSEPESESDDTKPAERPKRRPAEQQREAGADPVWAYTLLIMALVAGGVAVSQDATANMREQSRQETAAVAFSVFFTGMAILFAFRRR